MWVSGCYPAGLVGFLPHMATSIRLPVMARQVVIVHPKYGTYRSIARPIHMDVAIVASESARLAFARLSGAVAAFCLDLGRAEVACVRRCVCAAREAVLARLSLCLV